MGSGARPRGTTDDSFIVLLWRSSRESTRDIGHSRGIFKTGGTCTLHGALDTRIEIFLLQNFILRMLRSCFWCGHLLQERQFTGLRHKSDTPNCTNIESLTRILTRCGIATSHEISITYFHSHVTENSPRKIGLSRRSFIPFSTRET